MHVDGVWWKIDFGGSYKLSRVIIYHNTGFNQLQCQAEGCCWDEEAAGSDIACFMNECKAGYFGWRCRFHCHQCPTCDRVTGKCPTCPGDRWGVGCMLTCDSRRFGVNCVKECHCNDENENCQNNSPKGRCNSGCAPHFTGPTCQVSVDTPHCRDIEKRARIRCGASGVTQLQCQAEGCCWDDAARDSDIACYKRECKAGYFGWRCRFQCHKCPTCDHVTGKCPSTCQDDRWGIGCMLACDRRRFGVNCVKECHCNDDNENCQNNSPKGRCNSGCAPHFTGLTCQVTTAPWLLERQSTSRVQRQVDISPSEPPAKVIP
ncbi:hypothetical protein NP493_1950g00000 [Ridgeia piscesae]|uniref:P-type domain-containing protein n=1 Tax=Ridgeia piscesae TaxID=27915 RepID=A0AAD9JRA8_RIDPI|nr:hypothetical protein NP493_1950g00000 [Ridgeia piscesae]